MRVLIVDDCVDTAEIACELLRHDGHECLSATCGEYALGLEEAFKPELAILDIGLLDMDGHDLARMLRNRLGTAAQYFAAMSGWTCREDLARRAGFDYWLLKHAGRLQLQH